MPRSAALKLDALERWFQDGIAAPHERRKRRSRPRVDQVILPSPTLTARERLDLYATMYMARLHECLVNDFPAVERLVGHGRFHELTRAYIARYPSRTCSLNPLGWKLAEFLERPVRVPRKPLVRDTARLEIAMSQVFDAEDVTPLQPSDLAKIPPDRLAASSFRMVPAFQLLTLDYPVNALVTAVRQDKPLPPLRKRNCRVAVYRKKYVVTRLDLAEPACAALAALAAGKTVGEAVMAAARRWKGAPAQLQHRLRTWFGGWVTEGFFASLA